MTHDGASVSPNFRLHEFLPLGWDGSVPPEVLGNVITLAEQLLEPMRAYIGVPVHVTDAWRLPDHNAAVGGVTHSDHLAGRAADVYVQGVEGELWTVSTMRLFRWAVTALKGRYGQLILEDHRQAKKNESSFWIHAAIPSAHHPGHDDVNAALISPWPGEYIVYGGSNG